MGGEEEEEVLVVAEEEVVVEEEEVGCAEGGKAGGVAWVGGAGGVRMVGGAAAVGGRGGKGRLLLPARLALFALLVFFAVQHFEGPRFHKVAVVDLPAAGSAGELNAEEGGGREAAEASGLRGVRRGGGGTSASPCSTTTSPSATSRLASR